MKTSLVKKLSSLSNKTRFIIWIVLLIISMIFELLYWTDDITIYLMKVLIIGVSSAVEIILVLRLGCYIILHLLKGVKVVKSFYFYSCIALLFIVGIYIKGLITLIVMQTTSIEISSTTLCFFAVYVGLYLPLKKAQKLSVNLGEIL